MSHASDNSSWGEVEALFHAALDLPADERTAFVEQSCSASPDRRDQVLSLLRHDAQASGFTRIVGDAAGHLAVPPARGGSVVGAYRLLTRIGEGGMGVVYSAERADNLYVRRVAIKLVNTALVSDELRQRFMSERQILAALEHANIARFLDGGSTDDGSPYLVMEYVQGVPLDEYCDRRSLGVRERLELFVKICGAVHYAHQQLVIHCDLKMSNILVTDDGEPRLVDFGVSRLLSNAGADEAASEGSRPRRLTLRYASPEQVRDDVPRTATDGYALGVILYELLTGMWPHDVDADDQAAVMQAILEQTPRLPSQVVTPARARQLRGDLDSILMKSLQKEAADRYQSVARFSEDVTDYLALRPVMARAGNWHYRLQKLVRRNRVASMASTVLLLSALVFTATLAERNRQVAAQRDVAAFERDKAQAVTEFLTDMFAQATPDVAQGRDITVRAVLDSAGESLTDSLDNSFADNPLVAATIRRTIGDVYVSLGLLDTAEPHIEFALATLRREGQTETEDYVRALAAKDSLLGLRFEHEQAQAVSEESFAISSRVLGDNHPLTIAALNSLGVKHHMTGNLTRAMTIFEEIYRRQVARLGERHPLTIRALRSVGIIHHWLGNYTRTEQHYRDCVALATDVMGERHSLTLGCLSNLGSVLETTGRYMEAEPIIRQHLAQAREVLGVNHPETLRSMHNLADVYRGLGRTAQSRDLFQKTLERRREALGDAHVETLQTQMKLARLYRQSDDYDRALPLMQDTLTRQRDILGETHPTTLIAAQEMADLLLARDEPEAAAALYLSILAARESAFNYAHPDSIATLAGLAQVRLAQGNLANYGQLMRRAIALADSYPQVSVPGFAESRQAFLQLSDTASASVPGARTAVETH